MKSCWAANPDSRPTFATLLTKLLDIYSRRIDQLRAEQDALNQSYPDTRSRSVLPQIHHKSHLDSSQRIDFV